MRGKPARPQSFTRLFRQLRAWRLERAATTGLLVVCLLLTLGLILTAFFSYRAAQRAAEDVLFSRAVETADVFATTARLLKLSESSHQLHKLAKEMTSPLVGIALYTLNGRPLFQAGGGAIAMGPSFDLLRELRLKGQTHRLLKTAKGERVLIYWRPLLGARRGPGGGRAARRLWQQLMRQEEGRTKRIPDGKGQTPPLVMASGWPRPDPHAPPARPRALIRVSVDSSLADSLTNPAKMMVLMAALAALVLLLIGLVLHRAAAQAHQAELELAQRKRLAALGEMAAVLAHEVRTPLGSIKGNAQLLAEQGPEDSRINAMIRETLRLERLVNGLMDYARPAEPQRVLADPDQLMEQAMEIITPKALAARVNLLTDPAGCGACFHVDPDGILQILVNLLQNAIEDCADPRAISNSVVIQVNK
jgi:signal transduction histidine kinase